MEFRIDLDAGILAGARQVPSPNCDDRPASSQIEVLVIHAISLPPGQFGGSAVTRLFCNQLDSNEHPYYRQIEGLRVSAHLLITRPGDIIQFVPFHRRAWHAGVSSYGGRPRVNDFSIGIELEGTDDLCFEDLQYERLALITQLLCEAYPGLSPASIVGHADIAPGRKTDPGPKFDWLRYRCLLAARLAGDRANP